MLQLSVNWHYDKANEPWLRIGDICCVSITQHADGQISLSLNISLIKEFIEQKIRPLFGDLKLPCLWRNVASMKDHFHDELLGLEDLFFVTLKKNGNVFTVLDLLGVKNTLEL